MNKYVFDNDDMCFKDEDGDIVYCFADGCEAPASELVGESNLPLCAVCAEIWEMGYRNGYEDGVKGILE